MANVLQRLALKLAEKLLAFAQQKAFGRDDAFIYSRARIIVELDRINAEAAKKQEEFQAKMDLLEKEWKRQIRIVSWSTMSPAEANKDRSLMYQEDGIVESPPDSAAILQFPGKTTQQGGGANNPHRNAVGILFLQNRRLNNR